MITDVFKPKWQAIRALSFGWTWPAVVAGEKTVTRRDWSDYYARQWHKGDKAYGLNRDRRYGGKPIALIEQTTDPWWGPDADAPDEDFEAEGFAYLAEHPELLPKSAQKEARVTLTREAFDAWRKAGGWSWVIRFKVLEVYK